LAVSIERLRQSLILHEGLELKPYKCAGGALTIGIGRNLDSVGISSDEAMMLLDNDLDRCIDELGRRLPSWRLHDEVRQNVLIEMVFNLGMPRFLTFRRMIQALKRYDYSSAANEMLDSRWSRQVGQRSRTLAQMMRTGQWP
jgi:lysozyme